MILCDTGPLVALIDRDDQYHGQCVAAASTLTEEAFLTTWPCWTEAMHLLTRAAGFAGQTELWSFMVDGLVQLHLPDGQEWDRCRTLMIQYAAAPMDLADASLVVAAERMGIVRILTLDPHFRAYRMHGDKAFDVLP